jgi:ribonuclease PH
MRPTEDERRNGWTAPSLSKTEQTNHENAVIPHDLAAISVGLIDGEVYLDLDYILDSNADVDMNVVKTADGKYVEIQGTGEESTFSADELTALLARADGGLDALFDAQVAILDGIE